MMMEQHTEDLLSIDSIATMTGVSRRQLERLFEADMGASPSAIYMRIRMSTAFNMVIRTNKPLIEVALETGFESLSHFTRRFRAAFGDTPSQVRRDSRRQAS
jgi:transcriptional regulator GlxA family with amidase domain